MARSRSPRKLGGTDRFKYQPDQPNSHNTGTNKTWRSFFTANPGHGGLPLRAQPPIVRTTSDSLRITDEASPGRESYDSLAITDLVTRNGTFLRSISDSLAITDSVSSRPFREPTVIGPGTYAHTTVGTLTPGLPTSWQVDDILLITHFSNSAGSAPTGYTQAGSRTGRLQVYWRRATAGETDPVIAAAGNACARMVAIRGCVTSGDPFEALNAAASPGANTYIKTGGLTTLGDSRLYWASLGRTGDNSSPQFTDWQARNTEFVTEAMDDGFQDGLGGGSAGVYGGAAYAGAYGPFFANVGISVDTDYIEMAFIPGPYLRTTSDSVTISDSVIRVLSSIRSTSDSLAITDSADAIKVINRTSDDSLSISDSAVRVLSLLRSSSDSLTISDSSTRTVTNLRDTTDSLAISDSVDAVVIPPGSTDRTTADSLTISDVAVAVKILNRTSSDSIAISDAATRSGTFNRSTTDAIIITDSASTGASNEFSFFVLIG